MVVAQATLNQSVWWEMKKLFLDLEGPETKTMSFKPENSLGITYGMEGSLEKEIRYKTQADEMREK